MYFSYNFGCYFIQLDIIHYEQEVRGGGGGGGGGTLQKISIKHKKNYSKI